MQLYSTLSSLFTVVSFLIFLGNSDSGIRHRERNHSVMTARD